MKKNLGPWILGIIFAANFVLGFGYRLYSRTPYFDIILHLGGGLGVYLTLRQFFSKIFPQAPPFYWAILLIGATMLVGVLWEFAEFTGNVFFGKISGIELIGDLNDTLADLLNDLLGALLGAALTSPLRKRLK